MWSTGPKSERAFCFSDAEARHRIRDQHFSPSENRCVSYACGGDYGFAFSDSRNEAACAAAGDSLVVAAPHYSLIKCRFIVTCKHNSCNLLRGTDNQTEGG